ncbi:MAG: YggU family protein [Saprospiraceae bacterium]|nr:YggU family protein [Pyrinomonadaceae bacterium]
MEISESDGAITFSVRVVPRASKSEIVGEHDGYLRVRISAPPVDGAANGESVRVLAKYFGVAKSDVEIRSGISSRTKRIRVSGVTAARFRILLG